MHILTVFLNLFANDDDVSHIETCIALKMLFYLYFFICLSSIDVSGGESPSMLVAIRDCIKASNVLSFGKTEEYKPLSFKEAFFLATLGGSQGKISVKTANLLSSQVVTSKKYWYTSFILTLKLEEQYNKTICTEKYCSLVFARVYFIYAL